MKNLKRRYRERKARGRGLLEGALWIEDAAGLHVSDIEIHRWLQGSADYLRERARACGVVGWCEGWETYGG